MSLVLSGTQQSTPRGGNSDLSAAALSAVSTALIGNLAQRIVPALGAGVLRISKVAPPTTQPAPLVPTSAGPLATRVELGKNITSRIYVGYSHIFGAGENENSNQADIEYRISRRWALQSEYGDAGVGGFDLLWTKRY